MRSFLHPWRMAAAAVVVLAFGGAAQAAITWAGTNYVDVDARDASAGTSTWTNSGTLGGFTEVNDPVVVALGPNANPAVDFSPADAAYRGPATPGSLTGAGSAGTRTIEVWAHNPSIAGEETLVSLAKRGGPAGTNVGFNYGSNATYGAVGHWSTPDMGWNGTPAADQWHYLVYTYDGNEARVYADGRLANSKTVGSIDAYDGVDIVLASQVNSDGTTLTFGGSRGTLALASVRIHDGVLTAAGVRNNFVEDAARFGLDANGPAPLVHRYSFSESGGSGTTLADSVGGADAVIVDGGANDATAGRLPSPAAPKRPATMLACRRASSPT